MEYIDNTKFFFKLYKENVKDFNEQLFNDYDSDARRDYDTALQLGQISNVQVLAEKLLDENDWYDQFYVVFKYKDAIYKVLAREGSHGYGTNFDYYKLKEVEVKTKMVTYYE